MTSVKPGWKKDAAVEELVCTDDPVFLSALLARLAEAGVEAMVFDAHASSLFPGVMAGLGRRVMVDAGCAIKAKHVLAEVERQGAGGGAA